MSDYEKLLNKYGTKQDDKYVIGVLSFDVFGHVWKGENEVGHITTEEELKGVYELWNNEELK